MTDLTQLKAQEAALLEQERREKDALKKKLKAIKKQIATAEQKEDTKRAEILGRLMLARFKTEPARAAILRDLDTQLKRPDDRALFGLSKK